MTDPLRAAAQAHVDAECRCHREGTHDEQCELIVTENTLRAALAAEARPGLRPGLRLDVEALGDAIEAHVADAYRLIPKSAEHQDHSCHGGCASDIVARLTEVRP